LICNLKANKSYLEMLEYRDALKDIKTNINLIIAPSNLYLSLFKGNNCKICCQNLDLYSDILVTGSVPIKDLLELNVTYAIVGHYERRKFYHETMDEILIKIKNALDNNLKVIYCIGESKEELDRKVEYKVLEKNIAKVLNKVSKKDFKNIIIAYEPTYLIGHDNLYDVDRIEKTVTFIKKLVWDYYKENIDVVFGGNINTKNIDKLLNIKNLDGFIVGNASKTLDNVKKIIDKM